MDASDPETSKQLAWAERIPVGIIGFILGAVAGFSLLLWSFYFDKDGGLGAAFILFLGFIPATVIGGIGGVWIALKALKGIHLAAGGSRMQKARITRAIAFACCVPVFAFLSCRVEQSSSTPPSDDQMISNFNANRDQFGRFAALAITDEKANLKNIDRSHSGDAPRLGLPDDRAIRSQELCDSANVQPAFNRNEDSKEIDFEFWGVGSAVTDDYEKGYAYMTILPKSILPSLDGDQDSGDSYSKVYRPIGGNWYLYYEHIP